MQHEEQVMPSSLAPLAGIAVHALLGVPVSLDLQAAARVYLDCVV